MNGDFFTWFLSKHWLAAAVLFPELSLAWALWMRWYWWAAVVIAWLLVGRIR